MLDRFSRTRLPWPGLRVYLAVDSVAFGIAKPEEARYSYYHNNPMGIHFGTKAWAIRQKRRHSPNLLARIGSAVWLCIVPDADLWSIDIHGRTAHSGRAGIVRFVQPVMVDLGRVGSSYFQTELF